MSCNMRGCVHADTVEIPGDVNLGMPDDHLCPPHALALMVRYQDMATAVRLAMRKAVERRGVESLSSLDLALPGLGCPTTEGALATPGDAAACDHDLATIQADAHGMGQENAVANVLLWLGSNSWLSHTQIEFYLRSGEWLHQSPTGPEAPHCTGNSTVPATPAAQRRPARELLTARARGILTDVADTAACSEAEGGRCSRNSLCDGCRAAWWLEDDEADRRGEP